MTAEERIKLIQSVKNPPQEVIEETAKLTGEEHYAEWMHYYAERADMLVDLIAELESENKSLKNTLDKEQFFHSLCRAAYDERGQQYITLRKWARMWKNAAYRYKEYMEEFRADAAFAEAQLKRDPEVELEIIKKYIPDFELLEFKKEGAEECIKES